MRIAWRYLRAKKSHNAVNVITIISVAGVAVATMAMIVVLSIFNGFSDLAGAQMARIDPALKIERKDGRTIGCADSLASIVRKARGVRGTNLTIESRGLLVSGEHQTPVVFRGVTEDYGELSAIRESMIDGVYARQTTDADSTWAAVVSVGVANKMLATPDASRRMKLYVPRRVGRINPANPGASFRGCELAVSGVFIVGQNDYDNDHIFLPIEAAYELLEYEPGSADAIEVFSAPGADVGKLKKAVGPIVGEEYTVKDTMEQHSEAFRMISIEKWITFMMLLFILVVALFNIVSTLSLLVIEKRDNMQTLRALGASGKFVSRVFVYEGWLVTLTGGLAGIVLGIALSLVQQHFGLIRLAGDSAHLAVEAYPVRLSIVDVAVTAAAVTVTGFLASQTTRLFPQAK